MPLNRRKLTQAIKDMREARDTHVEWAEHFESCKKSKCRQCRREKAVTGDAVFHRGWVTKYENVLTILESL